MAYSITCSGSIALDTTRTPFKTVDRVLGGAASFFSLSASHFTKVNICSVVGADFPEGNWEVFERREIGTDDVQRIKNGKTFHYDCTYSFDLYHRQTNKTELNVLGTFEPKLGSVSANSEVLYLATMPPSKQKDVIRQSKGRKLTFMDTIELYMNDLYRPELLEVLATVDGAVFNDSEARMLTGESNLIKCGKKIQGFGPDIVIIKKGEHGSLLFYDGHVVPFPAYPLEDIKDPNGAGDSFAGGFLGCLASIEAVSPSIMELKTAMAYANVMGSLAVEDFSVDKLVSVRKDEIEKRFNHYCELLKIKH